MSLVGNKAKMLTVLEDFSSYKLFSNGKKYKMNYVKCRCECGTEKVIERYRFGKNVSCGCYHRNFHAIKNSLVSKFNLFENSLWKKLNKGASLRNLEVSISQELYVYLIRKDCFYCGAKPRTFVMKVKSNYPVNGIDRIDSSAGYTKENVVTCCPDCNIAKNAMTIDEFISWINKVKLNFTEEKLNEAVRRIVP